jgi:DNA-binding transcriptional LysR family regulator
MDWEKLKIFHYVAEAGSFTLAGKRLNMSQSALSRQIRTLEDSLDTSLFTRHARGLVLTTEGEKLFQTAKDVQLKIDRAQSELLESKAQPFGPLRITTTVTFGAYWLTPHLKEFVKTYPDIDIQLILSDDDIDLSAGQADVAIRFHIPEQADLIQRMLLPLNHSIYASPEYLTEKGMPSTAQDLDNHDLLVYGDMAPNPIKEVNWLLEEGNTGYKRKPLIEVNSIFAILEATRAGMGISSLPDYLAGNSKDLVKILPEVPTLEYPAYFVYPKELKRSKRIQAFKDFLLEQIKKATRN